MSWGMLIAHAGCQTKSPFLLGPLSDALNQRKCTDQTLEAIPYMSCLVSEEHASSISQDPGPYNILKEQRFLNLSRSACLGLPRLHQSPQQYPQSGSYGTLRACTLQTMRWEIHVPCQRTARPACREC